MDRQQPHQWVLIRGLVRASHHWGDFPARLSENFPGAKIVTLDLPGNGEFYEMASPLTIQKAAEFVRERFGEWKENMGAKGPTFVCAISLGAMVTLKWMEAHPNEITGAVLINTSLKDFSPFFHRLSPGAYGYIARALLSKEPREKERWILEVTSSKGPDLEELKRRAKLYYEQPTRPMNFLRQLYSAMRYKAPRKKPPGELLLLNSLGDRLVHPDCSVAISENWGVPLQRHAWAGHDLPLDDPQWALQSILGWYEALPPANTPLAARST